MFRHYLKIAFRNLWKNKSFSFINVLGLSVGLSVCFIIMLFVQDELSYDRFNEKADRIFRVVFKATINGGKINESNVMPPTAQALKNDYPEVEEATRLRNYGRPKIIYGEKTFKESEFAFVDANFFQVFTLPFVQGDASTALVQANTMVITKDMATLYFGSADPIGKVVSLNNELYKITGVIDNIPGSSHFHFDMFGSMESLPEAKKPTWMESNFFTYLVLKEGYDYKRLEAKLPGMVEKYMGPQIMQAMGMSLSQWNELGFALQPLTDIHLHSHTSSELEPGGDVTYIYVFGAIAIFMLVIACINFINLSTAGASKRAKEVGVRKVIGSDKSQLIKQFLAESLLVALIALAVSFLLIQLALPAFNDIAGKNLAAVFGIKSLAGLLALGIGVGMAAGIYPAFFLASFRPIAVLKGRISTNVKSFRLRSGLVVFQFFISVSLIVSTIVVYQQMKFVQDKQLGYDKEQLLVLPNSWSLGKNEPVFREQLLKDPRVVNATISSFKPAGPSNSNNSLAYPAGRENQIMKTLEYHVDDNTSRRSACKWQREEISPLHLELILWR